MTHPVAVQLSGIRKTFEGVVAVDNLNLAIPRGSTYGVLGPNGAGKTTTIRMVLRIIDADAGTIDIFGERLAPAALHRIGYLPEERGIYKNMKVRRLLSFFAELKGISAREARPRIMHWLERFDLADVAELVGVAVVTTSPSSSFTNCWALVDSTITSAMPSAVSLRRSVITSSSAAGVSAATADLRTTSDLPFAFGLGGSSTQPARNRRA